MPTVLVVDDDPTIRDLLADVLRDEGYSVYVAENGRQALEAVGRMPFDAMCLDLMMPEMDGREVLRRLWSNPDRKRPHIVVLSAAEEPDAALLRPVTLLRKPFDLDHLLEVLQQGAGEPGQQSTSALL